MIFLSKHGTDEYVEMFARGCGSQITPLETWRYEHSQDTLLIRGIMKHKIIKRCWQDRRDFFYMDSGYVGNRASAQNPHGWKLWHRIVPNNLQHGDIVQRPADRWERHNIELKPWRSGHKILIAAPDEKPCKFYNIDLDSWINNTIDQIKKHTDRPVEVRQRTKNRQVRVANAFEDALADVHAVVTFNSIAATESIIQGVPAFVLAPCNAALPVANTDLGKIDTPWLAPRDLVEAWAHHLAYGQFHINELRSGLAKEILNA